MIIQVIQLTATEVTGARFRRNGAEPTPISGFRLSWNSEDELVELLREQCPPAAEDIRTILALPPAMVTLRELSLPISDRRKIRAVLPLELAGETAQESPTLLCDAVPLTSGTLLAGWLGPEALEPLLERFREAGMDPEVVTLACLYWHLLLPSQGTAVDGDTAAAIHDDGALLATRGGGPLFCRHLGSGGATVEQTLTTLELTHNLQITHRFHLGAAARETSVSEKPLPLPPVLTLGTVSGDLRPDALLSPLAVALAYCAAEPIFNLRTGPLAWTGRSSQLLRTFRVPLILGAVLLALLFGELGTRWYLVSADLASLDRSIGKIYRDVFPTRKKPVDESAELKAEIRRLESSGSSLQPLPFLKLLADAKGDGINGLTEVELDEARFMVKGDARSAADVTSFRQRLGGREWNVDQPELTTRPNGTVLFTLRGSRGGSKP